MHKQEINKRGRKQIKIMCYPLRKKISVSLLTTFIFLLTAFQSANASGIPYTFIMCSRRTARMPAALWFSLALHGYMNVTTRMSHYRLCNGKRRNKNAVCGPMQIRFHRGSGDTNITN